MENRIDQPDKATTCVALAGPGSKCLITSQRGTIVTVTTNNDGTLAVQMVPATPAKKILPADEKPARKPWWRSAWSERARKV